MPRRKPSVRERHNYSGTFYEHFTKSPFNSVSCLKCIADMGSALLFGSGVAAATVKKILNGVAVQAANAWKTAMTLGLALMLGPGLAMAETNQLDATMDTDPTTVLHYASETIRSTDPDTGRYDVELEEDFDIIVKPRRRIDTGELYIRMELSGAHFGMDPSVVSGAVDSLQAQSLVLSSGGANMNFVVYPVAPVASGEFLGIRINMGATGDDLQLLSNTGSVSATISAHATADDALDGVGASGAFAGSGMIVQTASGLDVSFKPQVPNPVADVATGFVRFTGAAPANGQANIGWLTAQTDDAMDSALRSATNGMLLTEADNLNAVIPMGGTVRFVLEGNFDFGAFHVLPEVIDDMTGMPDGTVMCTAGSESSPDQGTLRDGSEENMRLIGEDGMLPSGVTSATTIQLPPNVYLLCVNIDITGPDTAATPIPESTYTAKAYLKRGAEIPAAMVGEGTVGSITRNGAYVEIPYLTTSEKHNQRLILVNRGNSPIPITGIELTAEDGVDVMLTDEAQMDLDAGMMVIPGNSSITRSINEVITFTSEGARRTAATINFFGVRSSISVATTQVNRSDSSTDTVVYEVLGE